MFIRTALIITLYELMLTYYVMQVEFFFFSKHVITGLDENSNFTLTLSFIMYGYI